MMRSELAWSLVVVVVAPGRVFGSLLFARNAQKAGFPLVSFSLSPLLAANND